MEYLFLFLQPGWGHDYIYQDHCGPDTMYFNDKLLHKKHLRLTALTLRWSLGDTDDYNNLL